MAPRLSSFSGEHPDVVGAGDLQFMKSSPFDDFHDALTTDVLAGRKA
jgi:hypothetical protein